MQQLVGAMVALGVWEGENTLEQHDEQARRLGGAEAYRLSLCNALLGAVQAQAVLADASAVNGEQRQAAWQEQLRAAGARDSEPEALIGFLRWQALRLAMPLRQIAAREQTGPIPLAAAHAVDGLQTLLDVIGAGQRVAAGQSIATADAEALPVRLRAAREALTDAVGNVDVLLDMLDGVEPQHRPFTTEELQSVERELLDAAVELAPPDRELPDSGTATLVLCGALAPLADGLRRHAGAAELRRDVARLGAAAATFLIALSQPGPSQAQLDSARRHMIVAVLHGDRGISRIAGADIDGERWFLRAVAAVGELMAEGSSGPPVTESAYASRVTGRALDVLAICGAWLAHTARRHGTAARSL